MKSERSQLAERLKGKHVMRAVLFKAEKKWRNSIAMEDTAKTGIRR